MKPVKLFSGHYQGKKSTTTQKIGFKLSVLCWHLFLILSGWACPESTFTLSLFHISRLHPYANILRKNALDHKYRLATSQPDKIPHIMIF